MTVADNVDMPRDYGLTGPRARRAIERGLASAEWYHSDVPRKEMKKLMRRSDQPALRDTVLWFGLLIWTGFLGSLLWGTWWSVPFWIVYGVLYGSASDSRWHECGHGTAFRTGWMNDVVYHIASFMVMRNPVTWRWSHARHHSDTIIVGRDPEIVVMRPPQILALALKFLGLPDTIESLRVLIRNAQGILSEDEKDFIPESEWPRAIFWARVHVAIYAATLLWAIASFSILPFMLIGGPRIYGAWHMVACGLLQHGGLAEDVLDHRLNSRTVYMNPVSRWIYWNMNYHVEHHMFPMVPFHALPRLHQLIRDDLPPPNTSFLDAYEELLTSLWRQRSEPGFAIRKELPPGARPYREEFHEVEPPGR